MTVLNDNTLCQSFTATLGVVSEAKQETFADRFQRLVEEAGLSVQDVVRIVGWKSEGSYYKVKRGDTTVINAVGLLRLAKRLGVSPYYLVSEPEPMGTAEMVGGENITQPDAGDLATRVARLEEILRRALPDVTDSIDSAAAALEQVAEAKQPSRAKSRRPS